jgi:hypothetical protein
VIDTIDVAHGNPGRRARVSDLAESVTAPDGHPQRMACQTLFAARWRRPPARLSTAVTTGTEKAEFLDFLKRVARAYPRRQLRVACDNYHTHKHADITAWLAKNRRITMHFTPTSGSWLNLDEVFFGIITRQAIRRGSFDSVKELTTTIHPFVWTKTLAAMKRDPVEKPIPYWRWSIAEAEPHVNLAERSRRPPVGAAGNFHERGN